MALYCIEALWNAEIRWFETSKLMAVEKSEEDWSANKSVVAYLCWVWVSMFGNACLGKGLLSNQEVTMDHSWCESSWSCTDDVSLLIQEEGALNQEEILNTWEFTVWLWATSVHKLLKLSFLGVLQGARWKKLSCPQLCGLVDAGNSYALTCFITCGFVEGWEASCDKPGNVQLWPGQCCWFLLLVKRLFGFHVPADFAF